MHIKQTFNKDAKNYDTARKQLIPCFDDFYGTAVDIIGLHPVEPIKVLDLGAGTGLFSSLVSQRFPNAKFTLCDISDLMLDEAKKRFTDTDIKIEYMLTDYARQPIKGTFDLIISALSIHHLMGDEKQKLFAGLYNNLNANGLFVNADQVLGETQFIENIYHSTWLTQVKEKGVTDEALTAALERMKADKMSTLFEQLNWLKTAKFSEVHCWYQNFSFVVFSGCKNTNKNSKIVSNF